MKADDQRLRQDLTGAFDGDDPGVEFDNRVMAEVEGGGGEHEISALATAPRRAGRWLALTGIAAAAILLVVILNGLSARNAGPNIDLAGERGESDRPFAVGSLELPSAKSVEPFKASLRIVVQKDEKVFVGGKVRDWAGLKADLVAFVKRERGQSTEENRGSLPHDGPVLISADRRVRWRVIQWVMQTCADPDVKLWRLAFQVESADGKTALPVPLPLDRDTGFRVEEPPTLRVQLKRRKQDLQTRVTMLTDELGSGEQGFAGLKKRVALVFGYSPHATLELNAWASVPFEDVVRTVDYLKLAGFENVTFVGAPPPGSSRASDGSFASGLPDEPKEEVFLEELSPGDKLQMVTVPFRLRMRGGSPELAPRTDADFEPLSTALPKLIDLIRKLKAKGKRVTAFVDSEDNVPYGVLRKILEACDNEGVTAVRFE